MKICAKRVRKKDEEKGEEGFSYSCDCCIEKSGYLVRVKAL